ncbi:ADP-dependent glucokinase [Thecamonas trahens ATCC 50062]|uniref:ADP-dependent glucokinase n=1 Tax=Thecamonas trahens ATCC 50062 TaxID=461836 RepID=A0A0L0DV34_THETB|nr:ADP-dependent glucokinase [Thecamonas trahens ATCC 50062]KNC56065.1 ADP-dependent glucokinase [Thecamonas trahens ATCC 50062]|eukprot:XP_013761109.1 ADP-dependent glucokinase [Thecamonas trahens ATCC 50062]
MEGAEAAALAAALEAAAGTSAGNGRGRGIALAYNSNLDLVVDAGRVFGPGGPAGEPAACDGFGGEAACEVLATPADVLCCFRLFAADGRAAERMVVDDELYAALVAHAAAADASVEHVGGNAALMAVAAAGFAPEARILLGGPVGPGLAALLPGSVELAAGAPEAADEVHLIIEYKAGVEVAGVVPPRANRFILHCDKVNGELRGAKTFHVALGDFAPDTVVLSGFHLLDALAVEASTPRVSAVVAELAAAVGGLKYRPSVHLELASMANSAYMAQLVELTAGAVDSIGFNEQELEGLVAALGLDGTKPLFAADATSHNVPSRAGVESALASLFQHLDSSASTVTRLHFHSLAYHVVCTRGSSWGEPAGPAAAGALAVGFRACGLAPQPVSSFNPAIHFDVLYTTGNDGGVETFTLDPQTQCALAPVLVCKAPVRTVGLGDSISAAGLLAFQYQAK